MGIEGDRERERESEREGDDKSGVASECCGRAQSTCMFNVPLGCGFNLCIIILQLDEQRRGHSLASTSLRLKGRGTKVNLYIKTT